MNKTRSAAQPFPDLAVDDGVGRAAAVAARRGRRGRRSGPSAPSGGDALVGADGDVASSSCRRIPPGPSTRSRPSGALIAPKALALTLFVRAVRVRPVHPRRGGRPLRPGDRRRVPALLRRRAARVRGRVDDDVPAARRARRHATTRSRRPRERLNRLEHNPDALLGEVEFDSAEERLARSLSPPRRPSWSSAIAAPGADKKALGLRIREVNAELADAARAAAREHGRPNSRRWRRSSRRRRS